MKKHLVAMIKWIPGIALSVLIAAVATFLEGLLPIHLIGSAVIAMFIGMLLNACLKKTVVFLFLQFLSEIS
jgi:hypothetical protein